MNQVSLFEVIKKKDLMLHFPYHSFDTFVQLLDEAAIDPNVVEIKMTLYRLAKESKVLDALINAARNEKKVVVVMELQARFDEAQNIKYSKKLREAGIRVIFGVPGLKVHSKIAVISRRENEKIMHFACIGTGNFNESTARLYTDHLLFSMRPTVADEANKVFRIFENQLAPHYFKHLLVAPIYMRTRITKMINTEIRNQKAGKKSYILLKLNNLVDSAMIRKLYQASNTGVKIQMIVRGVCSLVPGIENRSENIEVISIVDKFLEHSRVMIFHNGGDEKYYISSADLMNRNLDRRVEVACPIYDKEIQKELKKMFSLQWSDNVKARIVDDNLSNQYRKTASRKKIRSQFEFFEYLKKSSRK